MRVEVRKEVSLDNPNLRDLTPIEEITLAIRERYTKSKHYVLKKQKQDNEETLLNIKREDKLVEHLLLWITNELTLNRLCSNYSKKASELYFYINYDYAKYISSVKSRKELVSYDLEVLEDDPDMRIAFPNMPLRVICRPKLIEG